MSGVEHSTYYDRRLRQSPALIRARRPYLVKNTVLGLGIVGFTLGVYAYTIHVVGQDEFDDVQVPSEPQPSIQQRVQQLQQQSAALQAPAPIAGKK
ncbi:hypothetical protein CMQ_4904 [Grosmannia clavigera kw1407]|uniref:Cytochrome c oxidase assembly factor 3 n=1 Tax=Grosmannia clavigera (strain kw1407 / UAMH 11150) TaxID=655863 RepID=F0XV00_GROCL|nr:uncharacterized protein CMQ_4904 [Grosmannia clavigera kw1407]EFW99052.1 hypothetical protein CMQ_4904 [Grosmannia clavigera kw1407]